jgi:hypothetical protein
MALNIGYDKTNEIINRLKRGLNPPDNPWNKNLSSPKPGPDNPWGLGGGYSSRNDNPWNRGNDDEWLMRLLFGLMPLSGR